MFSHMYEQHKQYVCYVWDVESALKKILRMLGIFTEQYQMHDCAAAGIFIIKFDRKNKYFSHVGPDATEKLLLFLEQEVKRFYEEYKNPAPMISDEITEIESFGMKCCYVCGGKIIRDENDENYGTLKPVRDHSHFTGDYRGIAHNKCNLAMKEPKIIPGFAHKSSGYDEKHIRELEKTPGTIGVSHRT